MPVEIGFAEGGVVVGQRRQHLVGITCCRLVRLRQQLASGASCASVVSAQVRAWYRNDPSDLGRGRQRTSPSQAISGTFAWRDSIAGY